MNIKSKIIHTTGSPDKETKSIVLPIHLSTSFAMEDPSSDEGFQYGRINNPTREVLEKTLADLEGGQFAAVFSSGSAALFVLLATLKSSDHVICHKHIYEGSVRILKKIFINFDINSDFLDLNNLSEVKVKITNKTKFILFESPTNPNLEILDIKKICDFAHKRGIKVIVDNTLVTPIIQQPLRLGADIVIESLTKAINGHTDSIGGLLATNDGKLFQKIRFLQQTLGVILSPFDCFLILRGIKTLPVRLEQQQKNAKIIAKFLVKYSKVSSVSFPALLKIARKSFKKQMSGPGFIISFTLKQGVDTMKFLKSLKLVTIAHSFGGPETLIEHPATMMDKTQQRKNLLRLSIGLEDVNDLIEDLDQALKDS